MLQRGMHQVKMVITYGVCLVYQLQSSMNAIAIPHPPQCAHWGTFPSGEGFGRSRASTLNLPLNYLTVNKKWGIV